MKVLLASAPHADTFGYSMPPPGLLRLGGALRRAGHEPVLVDLAYELASGALRGGDELADSAVERLRDRCRARGRVQSRAQRPVKGRTSDLVEDPPDVVGISVMGATLPIGLAIARRLAQIWPDVPRVLGGPGTHGTAGTVLERFGWIDFVVRGEGERTLLELCDALLHGSALHHIDGVSTRVRGEVVHAPERPTPRDFDHVAPPAWDLLDPLIHYKRITGEADGLVPIDSGRGCVYDCSFCSIGRTWSRRSRPLPVARLLDEVAGLREMPGAHRAYLCHDLFGADREHALAFTRGMLERGIDVPWEVRARADHLDGELLRAMGAAGCDRVLLGIESASADVRRANQKGMSDSIDLLGVVEDCTASGITPILSLILGLPGETERTLAETLDFCSDAALRGGVNLSLHLVNPQPGCDLGERFASTARPVPGVPPDMALGAGESAEERALIDAHPDLFSTWALLPYEPETLAEYRFLIAEVPELLMRYPRTFAALRAIAGASSLALVRRYRAEGRTFETFARGVAAGCGDDELASIVTDLLAWETAIVRVTARGEVLPAPDAFRACGIVVESTLDLGDVTAALRASTAPGVEDSTRALRRARPPEDAISTGRGYVVVRPPCAPGRLSSVRTVRVGPGALRLFDAVSRAEREDEGARRALAAALRQPTVVAALEPLVRMGLVVAPAPRPGASPRSASLHAASPAPASTGSGPFRNRPSS